MSRKGDNIYKRKDGRWEGRYLRGRHTNGKTIYGYVYAGTYREAKKKLLNAQLTTVLNTSNDAKEPTAFCVPITFQEAAESWLFDIRPRIKESTYTRYHSQVINHLLPWFDNRRIHDINNLDVETFCRYLLLKGGKNGTGLSSKTATDILAVLWHILHYAENQGITLSCSRYPLIRKSPEQLQILSHAQQKMLCDYLLANRSLKNLGVLICLLTGIRIGELCSLKWTDISLCDKDLHIHRTMQRISNLEPDGTESSAKTKIVITEPKSARSVRTIPIQELLLKELASYVPNTDGYLLTGTDRFVEPRTMQRYFKKVLSDLAMPDFHFHALRHTFATRCIEVGFDVKSLSEILGHASVNITLNRYVHPSMDLKRSNMERLSDALAVS